MNSHAGQPLSTAAFNALTHPDVPTQNQWQFAVIGDTEDVRPVNEQMIADMKNRPLAFAVHVGDISSHGDEDALQQVKTLFAPLPFPTYYLPGNNDLVYDETLEIKTPAPYQRIIDERLYYSIDYRQAHIVLLDNSYRRFGFPDEELAWLKEDLDKNTQPLTFLFFHRPLNVPGQQLFGDDETPNSREQNTKFEELIAGYNISHIFNGHIHIPFSYTLNEIPVTVTGGGGALPQDILGGADAALFHYYVVTVNESQNTASYSLERIDFE